MPGAEGQESKDEAFRGLERGEWAVVGRGLSPLFQARRDPERWERGRRRTHSISVSYHADSTAFVVSEVALRPFCLSGVYTNKPFWSAIN